MGVKRGKGLEIGTRLCYDKKHMTDGVELLRLNSLHIAPLPGPKGRCSVDITKLILSIIDVAACLFLIAVVLLQSGKSAGLSGAIAGVADTFMAKNKAKSWDAKLAKITKWVAIGFMILTFVICLL